jgi:EPS-associated MarR family transcriptional regulator
LKHRRGRLPTAVACPQAFPYTRTRTTQHVASKQAHTNEDIQFRVLKLVQEQPHLKQRELADKLGVSLGKTNYCLRALVEKGQLKLGNFMRSNQRMGYVYGLTPAGLAHKAALAGRFLQRKKAEYEALRAEIDALQADMQHPDTPVTPPPHHPQPPQP